MLKGEIVVENLPVPAGGSLVLVVAEPGVVLERSVELGFSQGQTRGDENATLRQTHL